MKVTPADVAALQRLADDTADELRELEEYRARLWLERMNLSSTFTTALTTPMV